MPVRHLALETSTASGSLAAFDGGEFLTEVALDPDQRSAKVLAPALALLLKQLDWRATDLQLISVTAGPGSFTGLRVGVTTAKTLAYAAKAEVVGVNTLEVIAWTGTPERNRLCAVIDAFRGQVFAQHFTRDEQGQVHSVDEVRIDESDQWLESIATTPDVYVAGPVLTKLRDRLPTETLSVDESLGSPTAASVGQLAWRQHKASIGSRKKDDMWTLLPNYYRKSAAEEKLESS